MARSKSVAAAREELFQSQLSVDLDADGQIRIKCNPMFKRKLNEVLREIERRARADVRARHNRTGKLERSIHAQKQHKSIAGGKRITGTVTAGSRLAPYARYVHEGTNPHIIMAKPGKVLAFIWKGRVSKGRLKRMSTAAPVGALAAAARGRTRNSTRGGVKSAAQIGVQEGDRYNAGVPINDRRVVVKMVHHPGNEADRFLNAAAAQTVAGFGGSINLPRGLPRRPSR
jgi:hypothetical protein